MVKNTVLYGVYGLDRSLFVTMFCENKNNPVMKCNGKCKLAEMQQEEEKEKSTSTLIKYETEILFFSGNLTTSVVSSCADALVEYEIDYYCAFYSDPTAGKTIKPPESNFWG